VTDGISATWLTTRARPLWHAVFVPVCCLIDPVGTARSLMFRVPNGNTVIVLLEVAGQAYGLPVTVVQDALKVCRSGQSAAWRVSSDHPGDDGDTRSIEVEGRQIPLVDLRERLGLPHPTTGARTRMVLVVRSGEHWLSLLVDSVGEIVEVPRASIESAVGSAPRHRVIAQVARLGDRTIGVLDADLLLPAPFGALAVRP